MYVYVTKMHMHIACDKDISEHINYISVKQFSLAYHRLDRMISLIMIIYRSYTYI